MTTDVKVATSSSARCDYLTFKSRCWQCVRARAVGSKDYMVGSKVRVMTSDEFAAIDTIVLAFAADPMARWCWPGQGQFLGALPRLSRAFGGKAFSAGSAYCVGDYVGVALWLPPGIEPDEDRVGEVFQSTVEPSRLEGISAIVGEMAKYHPQEPHWYLPLIGVDPMHQGRGHGDTLMTFALERCDRDRVPAYLESSNPRNVSLYRRHGFEPLGTIQVASSPSIVPMLRRTAL